MCLPASVSVRSYSSEKTLIDWINLDLAIAFTYRVDLRVRAVNIGKTLRTIIWPKEKFSKYQLTLTVFLKLCKVITLLFLVRVFIDAMQHHDQTPSWGGKGLFGLYFHIAVYRQRKSSRDAGTWGQELLQTQRRGAAHGPALPWLARPAFYGKPRTVSPGLHYPQWAGPAPSSH